MLAKTRHMFCVARDFRRRYCKGLTRADHVLHGIYFALVAWFAAGPYVYVAAVLGVIALADVLLRSE